MKLTLKARVTFQSISWSKACVISGVRQLLSASEVVTAVSGKNCPVHFVLDLDLLVYDFTKKRNTDKWCDLQFDVERLQ